MMPSTSHRTSEPDRSRAGTLLRGLLALALCCATPLYAQTPSIPLATLGDLRTTFATVAALEEIPGPPLRGEVSYRSGSAFVVRLPMAAQRIEFLTRPGALLDEGVPVVRLSGPDVHHWLVESQAIAQQFEDSRLRYTKNRPLFEANALSAAAWADVQRSYFDLKLENEHREHVLSLAIDGDSAIEGDGGESLTLGAPMKGVVNFATRGEGHAVEETLFELIPVAALRMRVDVPWRRAGDLVALRYGDCRVAIAQVEQRGTGFFLTAWSESLSGPCWRPPGTPASVTPLFRQSAIAVPRRAVFQWEQTPHVFVRQGDSLKAIPVQLLGERGQDFVATGDALNGNSVVLTESVSAAQGILLGLGSEE